MVLERMIWVNPSFFVKDKDFYKTLVRLSLPAALQSLISLLVLMADKKKGLALQTVDKLNPLMKSVFNSLPSGEEEAEDE